MLPENERKVLPIKVISGLASIIVIGASFMNIINPLPYLMQTLASVYLMYTSTHFYLV
jgi:hypothetical protein